MLETRDLVKIYKPKKGVPVTALDKVSIKFPEKGMIFLLGKSGSGKSTLLNVLGGLDNYNSGEIIIKGVSSKSFGQKHFDSYRNTYVGFIFQEYNVLDSFTVGANIALAIELQNRKATDSEINEILKEVDLDGFGNRKPNELSGGQKQRVAIARALVKNPRIIMADEPTGALDSNTGKAIFDTLKKLSREKLVIVVSHDREFAENYADRIIELSDGRIISDVEYVADTEKAQEAGLLFNGDTIEIPAEYTLTEADRNAINDYISKLKSGSKLKVSSSVATKHFEPTDSSKIKYLDNSPFKLIKSKLPLKNAFKIGAEGLTHKKFRLVMTIILSCISFGLFGLADTFGAYNHIESCTNSLIDTDVRYAALAKAKKVTQGDYTYWNDYGFYLSDSDLEEIKNNTGIEMHGVYRPLRNNLAFEGHINSNIERTKTEFDIFNPTFFGFADINKNIINDMNFKILAGNLPDGNKNEIAISEYIFEIFKRFQYTDLSGGDLKYLDIKKYSDIVGKTLLIDDVKYTITAVIDTNFDLNRYTNLIEEEAITNADEIINYMLYNEFDYAVVNSYSAVIMTGDGFVDKIIANRPNVAFITEGYIRFNNDRFDVDSNYLARLDDVKNEKIVWLDGEKTSLGEKEIIATTDCIYIYTEDEEISYSSDKEKYVEILKESGTLDSWQSLFADSDGWDDIVNGYKIVGFIPTDVDDSKIESTVICCDSLFSKFSDGVDSYYSFCVGKMPESKAKVKNLVTYCYDESGTERYPIQNSVTYELDSVNDILKDFSKIFLYIGIGFAVFAALMLANFIGTSISYKKQEIGILRAIGSRSNDVFRIFFAESFIIAMINFLLSVVGVGGVTFLINYLIRHELGILITILTFDLRQVILLLAVSILVAFVASYLPVKKIASKRPIDAIRDR